MSSGPKLNPQMCAACAYAVWQLAKNGRVNSKRSGRCHWTPEPIEVPHIIYRDACTLYDSVKQKAIWFDDTTPCGAYRRKQG